MKRYLLLLVTTKLGWLGISLSSAMSFLYLETLYDWSRIPFLLSWVYPVVLFILLLIQAFIIDPIKEFKLNNNKEDY